MSQILEALVGGIAAVLVGLTVIDLKRWLPWIADQIVRRASSRFDPPHRDAKEEEYRANVLFAEGPISSIMYALFTYLKAPNRA